MAALDIGWRSIEFWDFVGNILGFVLAVIAYVVVPKYTRKRIAEGKIPAENARFLKGMKFCFMSLMLYFAAMVALSMIRK